MRVCIHRGTNEIGGTCIELQAADQRLILDLGLPLSAEADQDTLTLLPAVPGLREPASDLAALIISHPHQDHYGLVHLARPDLPVVMGNAALRILRTATYFTPSGLVRERTKPLQDRKPIDIGPFRVTPFLVDHSAYDAYALMIDANSKRLFYSGDFRGHGRKASLFKRLLCSPPKDVDILLMEGTTMSRGGERDFLTESELETKFVDHFREARGMALVWTSSQNIDRIVTIFRACRRIKRQLIIDLYTAEVLRATGNENVPQGTWDGVRVFLPNGQRRIVKEHKLFDRVARYKANRIYPEDLQPDAQKSVMLFRPGIRRELDAAGCLEGSRLAYSLWDGYLRDPRQEALLSWLADRSIPIETIHTSGHASPNDLSRFAHAINPKALVPIHTFAPDSFDGLFPRIEQKCDGIWWTIK